MADFFDKMRDSINKGVATVSTGSKTMIEKSKINAAIKTLEDEKKQLAEMLGNKVFHFCTTVPEGDVPRDELISFCNEIISRNEQILVHRKKIEELDAEMNQVKGTGQTFNVPIVCSCGCNNVAGAKFCAKCGNKLQ